jgi:hypothetical protein
VRHATSFLCLASLAAYANSFALPTFDIVVEGRAKSETGFAAFEVAFFALSQEVFGGLGVFVMWLANPAFWAGVVLFACGRYDRALIASCAAVLLGSRLVFAPLILVGYYMWLAGMALLLAASAVRLYGSRQAIKAEPIYGQASP